MRYDLIVLIESISSILFALPRFSFFNSIKSIYLRLAFRAKVGKKVVFYSGVWISPGFNLELGDHVDLAKGVFITTSGGVSIGPRTLVGYKTNIFSSNHVIPPLPGRIHSSGHTFSRVCIGSDVWIGASCTILPGVSIGDNCVVAAGSVVTKSFPSNSILAGVPARVIRLRS